MHRIWRVVLEPALSIVSPRIVVETGCDGAEIHRCLLDFCQAAEATLHSVEDLDDALDDAPTVDAILVASPGSWHRTSTLLERIDEWRREQGRSFPFLMLRGARRTRFDVTANGTRMVESGVAGAIESFVASTNGELESVLVPALEGVGFVFPAALRKELPDLGDHFRSLEFLADMETEEQERLEADRMALDVREEESLRLRREREDVEVWFEELAGGTRKILNSRRWKMGNAVAELRRRILLKRRAFREHFDTRLTIDQFRAWRRGERDIPKSLRTAGLGMRSGEPELREIAPGDPLEGVSVDVVVCVHNALAETQECLASVVESRVPEAHRLLIVNDGSDGTTTEWLRGFAEEYPHVDLIEVEEAEGYTKAANRGLRESAADWVVLLNSDTVVPAGWLEKILECGDSDPRIGIVGPLSNAASWQSVPNLHRGGRWAVNSMPFPDSVEDTDELVDWLSPRQFPRMPFLNGFCYAIKRKVLQSVGYLDEATFPKGYGEEDDYSIRAREEGHMLAVADHLFVYHAKSKSFGAEKRDSLSLAGQRVLKRRYGEARLLRDAKEARDNRALRRMRRRVRRAVESLKFDLAPGTTGQQGTPAKIPGIPETPARLPATARDLSLAFVVPSLRVGEEERGLVELANEMVRLGIEARIVTQERDPETADWSFAREPLVLPSEERLRAMFPAVDVAVATDAESVECVAERVLEGRVPHGVQLLAGYEVWNHVRQDEAPVDRIVASYDRLPTKIVLSNWLASRLASHGHDDAIRLPAGIDLEMFYPRILNRRPAAVAGERPPVVLAHMRPERARYGFVHGIETLRALSHAIPTAEIVLFGADLASYRIPFEYRGEGIVSDPNQLAELFSEASVFVDPACFLGSGRMALEAMACGVPCVLPSAGGVHEIARDGENAVLVTPNRPEERLAAILRLLRDEPLAESLRQEGFRVVERFDVKDMARRLAAELGRHVGTAIGS